uniref:fibronectin type III domain-containing protein n=1 Tax=Agreia sp. TaxID=1872416 RepID=UPI0035BC8F4F
TGTGPASAASAAVTLPVLPAAPTWGTVTASDSAVSLNWVAPADGGSALTAYEIQRRQGTGAWLSTAVLPASSLATTVKALDNGAQYAFRIRAFTAVGTGPWSSEITAIPLRSPDAPTGLTATPGDRSARLGWAAPQVDGGSPITGYAVRYRAIDAANWVSAPNAAATSTTLTGLANGTGYEVQVAAVNAAGTGAWTASTTVTPATFPDAPGTPSPTPRDRGVDLAWAAPAYDGGAPVLGYVVEYRPVGGAPWRDGPAPLTPTAALGSLDNGTAYEVRIAAVNLAGTGPWTAVATFTPRTVATVPTMVAVTPGDESATVTWGAPFSDGGAPVTAYRIQSRAAGAETWEDEAEVPGLTVSLFSFANGTEREFRVAAVNVAGVGPWSQPTSTTPRTVPDAPTSLAATPGDHRADLTWTAPADGGAAISSYEVQASVDGAAWVDAPSVTTASAGVVGLDNGTQYAFRVRAVNAAGAGGWSEPASSTPRTVPDAIEWSTAVAGDTVVELTWAEPADGGDTIDGYTVQQSVDGGAWTDAVSTTESSATISGLENGTSYRFRVRAANDAGSGAWSAIIAATPRTTSGAPAWKLVEPRDSAVALSWAPPAETGGATITGYEVEVQSALRGDPEIQTADGTELVVDELDNGTEYSLRVRALNVAGAGVWGPIALVVPRTVADAPVEISIVPTDRAATLSWNDPVSTGGAAPQSYDIEYRVVGADKWITAPPATSSPTTVTGLRNGVAHEFRVRVINVAGPGEWSESVSTTPFDFAPRFSHADGRPLDVGSVSVGSEVTVQGAELPAGATVTLDLHSAPVRLGTTTVAADGTFELTVTIPDGTALGGHELVAVLTGTGAEPATASVSFTVAAAAHPAGLASTGSNLLWPATAGGLLAALLGALLLARIGRHDRLAAHRFGRAASKS